jgi:hypothetical protein
MAYYFSSDFSQSNTFKGYITALAKQIQQHGNDPQDLERFVTDEMQTYFGRYFDTVTVNVTTDLPSPTDPTRLNLTTSVIVTENGQNYSLGRLIETLNGKIARITKINNSPN